MANYFYEGMDVDGSRQTGMVEAKSRMEALQKLQEQNITPLKVKKEGIWQAIARNGQLGSKESFRIVFCQQMAIMLEAGIPITEAVEIAACGKDGGRSPVGERLKSGLKRGYTLSEAMKLTGGYFSTFMQSIARAGEMSGNLAAAMKSMHEILYKNHAVAEKFKRAMLYPLFLCIISIAMIVFLVHQVLPVFAGVFTGFNAQLPWTTELLLRLGENLPAYTLGGGVCIVLLYLLLQLGYRQRAVGIWLDRLKLRIPLLGGLYWKKEQAVFFNTLSILLNSGIRINYGVSLLKDMCSNHYLRFMYESMLMQLSQGYGLGACMSRSSLYSPMLLAMVGAGEKTGEMGTMLSYAGRLCQSEAEELMERVNVLAEPLIILVLGLVVGFIVMSTILPIFDLMTVF